MRVTLFLFVALIGALPAWAHHSFGATFDATKPVTITGVLTKVQWTRHSSCARPSRPLRRARRSHHVAPTRR